MSTLLSSLQMTQVDLGQFTQRRALKTAVSRAYDSFASEYPDWADYLFDEHFLNHRAAALLASYVTGAALPDPVALARAWAEQMRWVEEATRQERIAQLIPVASHFLALLEAEI